MTTESYTFTHDKLLDTSWKPAPGQKYADAPKAAMRVFRATQRSVWYGYADATKASHVLDRAEFVARFGEPR